MGGVNRVTIVDRSTNGTFVDGKRAPKGQPVPVSDGTELGFGSKEKLTVRFTHAHASAVGTGPAHANPPGPSATWSPGGETSPEMPQWSFADGTNTNRDGGSFDASMRTHGEGAKEGSTGSLQGEPPVRKPAFRPQLRSTSSERQRAKRQALIATAQAMLPELSVHHAGQFVVVHGGGAFVMGTKDEAEALDREHLPRIVLEIPPREQLMSRCPRDPEPGVHQKNLAAFEAKLESLRREYPGHWVAIHDGEILGVHEDRHALVARYYREEYFPVLVAQILPAEGGATESVANVR